ncbi:c6 finger domain-containing protein [Stemphylium lycopersici]|nr:c6 finger domain-containing protein [Stemphylium lycopersici]
MDGTPPRPDVEFDFNLPHGIDDEENIQDNQSNASLDDQNMGQPNSACNVFEEGFSDDDGAAEAFDRSWPGHQARKSPPKDRMSSRNDNEDDEMSPGNKRPRQSLFGGPGDEAEESPDKMLEDPLEHSCKASISGQVNAVQEQGIPGLDIADALPSLSPDPPLSDFPFNAGSGLSASERDSVSPRNSQAPSSDTVTIPPDTQVRTPTFQSPYAHICLHDELGYGLRTGIDRKTAFTFLDQDTSGNFDPADEERKKSLKQKQDKAAKASRRGKKGKQRASKELVKKCIARLHFESFGNVRNITNDQENWPDSWSDEDSEVERKRQKKRDSSRRRSPEYIPQTPVADPSDELDDLTGHPAARGWYRANRIRIDEIIYGEDRPFIQCEICRRTKKRCSLKKKTDKPPCKSCKKYHLGCTFYELPKVEKKSAKCKNPTEGDAPEVSQPGHDYFTAEDLEDLNMKDVQRQSRSPTPEMEMEDNDGHKGMLIKVKTCFAQPIIFSGPESTFDCNFCELPSFGFVGLFEREVHVIRWHDGLGLTEVGGGHAENNGQTTMCQDCTFHRVQIMSCEDHHLQRLFSHGIKPDFEDAMNSMLEAEDPVEVKQQLQRWCSMCFSPAMFTCRRRQVSLLSPEDAEVEIDGCGLKLCTECERKLREEFVGDSCVMAATLDLEGKVKEEDEDMSGTVVRADVGFLSRDGLLMKNLDHSAEVAGY